MRVITACLTVAAAGMICHVWFSPPAAVADDSKDEKLGHGYSRKAGHILFKGQRIDEAGRHDIDRFAKAVGHPLTLCKDVDAPSFVPLSEEYSKDKNKVYYKWVSPGRFWVVELADADPATFAVLDFNLAKDGKQVWKGDTVIEGADAATAKVIRPHWTWTDGKRVYYQSVVIAGADPDTFKHLGQGFYRDAKRVYWCNDPLPEADPDSFKAFGDDIPYASDRNHVWSGNHVLKDVDAKSFDHVHDHVYKDSKRVYVGTSAKEVLQADAASFAKVARLEPGETALFRDRSRHYVYDPTYSEVYTLERKADGILISKPVWLSKAGSANPAHGATVSAMLKDGTLSEADVTLEPTFKDEKPPTWEKDKLKRLLRVFVAAQKHMAK
jgi:hypothetical protein